MTATVLADPKRLPFDRRRWVRALILWGSGALMVLIVYAIGRWTSGIAPATPWIKRPAFAVHLVTAIPALPLGAYLMLRPKGDALHRALGKLWLILMSVTAAAAFFIRTIGGGGFSPIHIFVVITAISVPRAYLAARRGDITAHRRIMVGFFLGASLVAGLTAFLPGRTMWLWAFG